MSPSLCSPLSPPLATTIRSEHPLSTPLAAFRYDIEQWALCMYPYTITLSFAWIVMLGATASPPRLAVKMSVCALCFPAVQSGDLSAAAFPVRSVLRIRWIPPDPDPPEVRASVSSLSPSLM